METLNSPLFEGLTSHAPTAPNNLPAQDLEAEIAHLRSLQTELEARQQIEGALTQIADEIRVKPGETPQQWADRWLLRLMDYVPGLQAAVYLAETDENEMMKLYAAVAAPDDVAKIVIAGQGANGQVVRSKKPLYLDSEPSLVSNSRTSLLHVKIAALLIEPLIYNEICTGVLEIGFIQPVSQAEQTLVQRVAERVAATWLSLRDQIRIQTLWGEAQQKGEQLAAQEEELRQNLEEMQATQEELARRQQSTEVAVKTILSASVDPIIIISDRGIVQTFNLAAQTAFGYSEDEVIGQNVSMLMPSPHTENHDGYLANYHQTGEARVMGKNRELEARRKDGTTFPIELAVNEAMVEGKRIYVGVMRDVTERNEHDRNMQQVLEEVQASEEELRQQTEELQATQDEMRRRELELQATMRAIESTLATIEFAMDGSVLKANAPFLNTMGYTLEEIQGKHHRMFLTPEEVASTEYGQFWKHLNEGTAQQGEFRRVASGSRPVWLRATYTPVMGPEGKPVRVMKLALDITAEKMAALEHQGHLMAIQRSTATVEFDMEGHLLWANDLFLNLMGYTLLELKGQQHSTFVKPAERKSDEYVAFWKELKAGNFVAGEFERVAKDGKPVWIQGSYNPVMGPDGKPVKVVKVAIDTTAIHQQQAHLQTAFEEIQASEEELRQQAEELQATQEEMRRRERELQASMRAIESTLATIEFAMDGSILKANAPFLTTMGYTLEEIQGKHHRMFLTPEEIASTEYGLFWKHLNEGTAQQGEFRRVAVGGRPVWLRATYTPVMGPDGKPIRVMKLALDITAEKMAALEHQGHLMAIQRSTATVEFDMEGRLLWANDLFLNLMGYTLLEVKGQKHSTFVKPAERKSAEYAAFWKELKAGNFVAGEFERVGKDGKPVWIQGSYNPVMGPDGKPVKVVKVAIDTTAIHQQQEDLQRSFEEMQASEEEIRQQAEELHATQEEMGRREQELKAAIQAIDNTLATIEFGMDGHILRCNQQFAQQTGYAPEALNGQHHKKLMPKGAATQPDYVQFWEALNRAEPQQGTFERIGANGKRLRMHATYTPVLDAAGKPVKVMKLIQRIEPVAN